MLNTFRQCRKDRRKSSLTDRLDTVTHWELIFAAIDDKGRGWVDVIKGIGQFGDKAYGVARALVRWKELPAR